MEDNAKDMQNNEPLGRPLRQSESLGYIYIYIPKHTYPSVYLYICVLPTLNLIITSILRLLFFSKTFRATIIKNKGQWFMDDGDLTKQLCPETEIGECENEEPEPCCACDEAKYEVNFISIGIPASQIFDFLSYIKYFPFV